MSGKAFTFLLLVIIKHSTSIRVFSLKYLNVLLFQQSRITANLFAIKISSLSVAIKFPVKIYALSPDQYLKSPEPCQYVDVHLEISSYDLRLWCLHPFRRSYCSLWARFPPRDLLHHHLSKQAWPNDGRFVGDPYFSWSLGFGAGLDGTIFVESLDQGETHKQALGQGSIISAVENQSDRFDEKPKQNKTWCVCCRAVEVWRDMGGACPGTSARRLQAQLPGLCNQQIWPNIFNWFAQIFQIFDQKRYLIIEHTIDFNKYIYNASRYYRLNIQTEYM